MTEIQQSDRFTETHHALLHGWIAQAVFENSGEQSGKAVIRKAVRRYGEERGRSVNYERLPLG